MSTARVSIRGDKWLMKSLMSKKRKRHACLECQYSTDKKFDLNRHVKTVHKGQKDFKCDECGKSFGQVVHLKRHVYTVHQGQKDFKCDKCAKHFKDHPQEARVHSPQGAERLQV